MALLFHDDVACPGRRAGNGPPRNYYVEVKDLDGTIERIKSKGGKLMNGPVKVPTGSRIAQMIDPQGAAFAIHELGS